MIQRVAIVFADDTNFCVKETNYKNDMQKILNKYTLLYEATGGKI